MMSVRLLWRGQECGYWRVVEKWQGRVHEKDSG